MDHDFMIFCAFALIAEIANMAWGTKLSELSIKLGIIEFEFKMKFR